MVPPGRIQIAEPAIPRHRFAGNGALPNLQRDAGYLPDQLLRIELRNFWTCERRVDA